MSDASDRIKEHRERQEQLELAAEEARAVLAERRVLLDSADTIARFASDMSEFLRTSELTETKTFVRSFVKQITVKPGQAVIHYTIPTPEDSPIGSADGAEVALNQRVMSTVHVGSPNGIRTRATSLKGWRPRPLDDGAGDCVQASMRVWRVLPARSPARRYLLGSAGRTINPLAGRPLQNGRGRMKA